MTRGTSMRQLPLLALLVPALAVPASTAFGQSMTLRPEEPGDSDQAVVSVQGVSVDADRGDRFELNREVPEGVLLDFFRYSAASEDGKDFVQLNVRDAAQQDMRVGLRSGLGNEVKLNVDWIKLPYRQGSGAIFPLGAVAPDQFRIADFIQQGLEDPSGLRIPFYSQPGGQPDNGLVQGLTSQLLEGFDPFSVGTQRDVGRFDLELTPGPRWKIRVEGTREWRDGQDASGSGTYQRITDVNGDGQTNYDYFFSVRGIEIPATVEYRTTNVNASAAYAAEKWFGKAAFNLIDFDNSFTGMTYDNPFWFTDTEATSGSRRGLSEQARWSLPPSNKAWHFNLQGGITFSRRTQLTLMATRGRITQDESFLPITTNTALIATKDLNGDGAVDERDDPTSTSVLPRSGLGAEVDTTVLSAVFSTRAKRVTFNARAHYYDYDSGHSQLIVPARAEYIESRLKTDFKGDEIIHIPLDFSRARFGADLIFKVSDPVRLALFGERIDRTYDRYQDTDGASRDTGTRAVSGTGDNRFGATLFFTANPDFGGRVTYRYANRDFDGTYQPGFSGENPSMRQWDLAKRKRNAFEGVVDFFGSRQGSLSLQYDYTDDDYSESDYGLQAAKGNRFVAHLNWAAGERTNLFAWGEWSRYEYNSHLRTKCANCSPPPGATWTRPWDVPNYDWFSDYTDTTVGFGAGLDYATEERRWVFEARGHWVKGEIEQLTRNPGTPLDLSRPEQPVSQVALGYDFPDQTSETILGELRLTRRFTDKISAGVLYWVEVLNLDDFMWNSLDPYGHNVLTVDDATRYLFLDSRYTDHTANVFQAFVRATF